MVTTFAMIVCGGNLNGNQQPLSSLNWEQKSVKIRPNQSGVRVFPEGKSPQKPGREPRIRHCGSIDGVQTCNCYSWAWPPAVCAGRNMEGGYQQACCTHRVCNVLQIWPFKETTWCCGACLYQTKPSRQPETLYVSQLGNVEDFIDANAVVDSAYQTDSLIDSWSSFCVEEKYKWDQFSFRLLPVRCWVLMIQPPLKISPIPTCCILHRLAMCDNIQ